MNEPSRVSLVARTLCSLHLTAEEATSIPAGTQVLVVGYDSLEGPHGCWLLEYEGQAVRAPHDAIELLPTPSPLTFNELLQECLRDTVAPIIEQPGAWGDPGDARPSAEEINSFLIEKELQYRNAGTMSREEFLRRKEVLMGRARRAEGKP